LGIVRAVGVNNWIVERMGDGAPPGRIQIFRHVAVGLQDLIPTADSVSIRKSRDRARDPCLLILSAVTENVVDFSRFSARGGSATSATAGWLAFSGNCGHCGQVVFNS